MNLEINCIQAFPSHRSPSLSLSIWNHILRECEIAMQIRIGGAKKIYIQTISDVFPGGGSFPKYSLRLELETRNRETARKMESIRFEIRAKAQTCWISYDLGWWRLSRVSSWFPRGRGGEEEEGISLKLFAFPFRNTIRFRIMSRLAMWRRGRGGDCFEQR